MADLQYSSIYSGEVFRPMIRFKIRNLSTGIVVAAFGLVDSGCDLCCFPAEYASKLGHNLDRGARRDLEGFDGSSRPAYLHENQVEFEDPAGAKAVYRCPTYFSEALDGYGLLGIRGFFSHFRVTIDNANRLISLAEY